MINLRAVAAKVINNVVANGQSLSDALNREMQKVKIPRNRAFLQALCFGVCRHYFFLERLLDLLLDKPIKEKEYDIKALLLIGLLQLEILDTPEHAAVAETVAAAKFLRKSWTKPFINATLRNFIRRREELLLACEDNPSAMYNHPQWMIDAISQAWPEYWREILIANNQHPPFTLRVNQQHFSRDDYLLNLKANEMSGDIVPETPQGIILREPVDVSELPGFLKGDVSVQDAAAQLAAGLLELQPHLRVLDACAAPGGKAAHILEMEPSVHMVAIEKDPGRVGLIEDNFRRLRLSAECVLADAGETEKWWDGSQFDRILLDAPCSATGVIRRHPDIKQLRRPDDVLKVVQEQWRLLTKLWPLLKNNGLLLYATCSIFPQENTELLEKFLQEHPDAQEDKIRADWGVECKVGRQIFPGMSKMDGFYYCKLRKVT